MAVRSRKKVPNAFLVWLSQSYTYILAGAVLVLITIFAVYRTAEKMSEDSSFSKIRVNLPNKLSEMKNPLTQEPWEFFHPIWKKKTGLSFFSVMADNSEDLPDSYVEEMEKLVEDPRQRLEAEFQVPPALKKRVSFWLQIYTRFSSRIRVVHDRGNLGIIYGYIDLRPIYRVMPSLAQAEAKSYRIETAVLKQLKVKMAESMGISKSKSATAEEKDQIRNMLSDFGALSPQATAALITSVRTQSGQSDMFLAALSRSKNLLPHIESVFRRQNLPVALARIPFVESSFNVRAQSKIGAVGIWQFTRETAQQMIHTDEEKLWSDPIRQTASAARLLSIYRSLLPDWGTTVTSYNSGVGRLRRLTGKYRIKRVEDLFKIPQNDALGFAGNNFFSEFLAANIAEAYKEEIFSQMLLPVDYSLVFKGNEPFPKEVCDL